MTFLSDCNCHRIHVNFSAHYCRSTIVRNKLYRLAFLTREYCMLSQKQTIIQTSVGIRLMQHFTNLLQCFALANTKLYRATLFFFNLHSSKHDTTGVRSTAWTYTGVTSRSFNVQTSFCVLSTGLELPYMHVLVFGREVVLYARTKHEYSSFGSTLVLMIFFC